MCEKLGFQNMRVKICFNFQVNYVFPIKAQSHVQIPAPLRAAARQSASFGVGGWEGGETFVCGGFSGMADIRGGSKENQQR